MALDRATVVRAAIILLDEVGLDDLTVRRLAGRLEVQNPALYWHFKNKQDLLNGMAEAILEEAFAGILEQAPRVDWVEWLSQMAHLFHEALLAHRDGARVIAAADLSHSSQPLVLDLGLRVLVSAGFTLQQALAGMVTVFDYTVGSAFEEQAEQNRNGEGQEPGALFDPARFPALAAVFQEIASGKGLNRSQGFASGLGLIISGLRTGLEKQPS